MGYGCIMDGLLAPLENIKVWKTHTLFLVECVWCFAAFITYGWGRFPSDFLVYCATAGPTGRQKTLFTNESLELTPLSALHVFGLTL